LCVLARGPPLKAVGESGIGMQLVFLHRVFGKKTMDFRFLSSSWTAGNALARTAEHFSA
jgi:hypothetical protein